MADSSSQPAAESASPAVFALADKPVEEVSFRQILTQEKQRPECGDIIFLTALMNSLEVGLFYLYYGDTGV